MGHPCTIVPNASSIMARFLDNDAVVSFSALFNWCYKAPENCYGIWGRMYPLGTKLNTQYWGCIPRTSMVIPDSSLSYWLRWERNLEVTLSEAEQVKIAHYISKSARSVRYQESGYKLLTSWYCTPTSLHKMFPGLSICCWRCGERREAWLISFGHVHWSNHFRIKLGSTYLNSQTERSQTIRCSSSCTLICSRSALTTIHYCCMFWMQHAAVLQNLGKKRLLLAWQTGP